MCKKLLVIIISILFLSNSGHVHAQSDVPKFELGAQFTAIRQNDDFYLLIPEFDPRIRHNFGYGGRFTFNTFTNLSFEAELNYFPKERGIVIGPLRPGETTGTFIGGKRTQGLFGIKAGKRTDRFGIFGKVRPGFMRLSEVFQCEDDGTRCRVSGKSEFALDIGGVVEFYPERRVVIRFDIGDTIIRYDPLIIPIFLPDARRGGGTTNNLQTTIGLGIRF